MLRNRRRILENLRNLPHAPGVQMQQVPTKRVARELGMKNGDESDPEDEVESRLRSVSNPSFAHFINEPLADISARAHEAKTDEWDLFTTRL